MRPRNVPASKQNVRLRSLTSAPFLFTVSSPKVYQSPSGTPPLKSFVPAKTNTTSAPSGRSALAFFAWATIWLICWPLTP